MKKNFLIYISLVTFIVCMPSAIYAAKTSNTVNVIIRIIPDPVFSLGTIIGKVYHDKNENGMQDSGEKGLEDVRLMTSQGIIITTDAYGRYHIPAIKSGRQMVKIDITSLPKGSELTTENHHLVTSTDGLLNKINFGIKLPFDDAPETLKVEGLDHFVVSKKYRSPQKFLTIRPYPPEGQTNSLFPDQNQDDMKSTFKIDLNYANFIKSWKIDFRNNSRESVLSLKGDGSIPSLITLDDRDLSLGNYEIIIEASNEKGKTDRFTFELNIEENFYNDRPSHSVGIKNKNIKIKPITHQYNIPLRGDTIVFEGEAARDSNLKIANESVIIHEDGTFKKEFILPEGQHYIPIHFESTDGITSDWVKPIEVSNNYFFLVGFGEYEGGRMTRDGNTDSLTQEQRHRLERSYYQDSSLQYYLKAKWDKYVLTSSLDTDREEGLFLKNLEIDDLYPTFGDFSKIQYDATDTQDELYAQVEFDQNYARWGNFGTGLTGSELAHFNRTLQGGKIHYESLNASASGKPKTVLSGYTAQAEKLAAHNELRGTGGTLYFLKNKDIIKGSEKIVLEERDAISGITIGRKVLTAGNDYDIDYSQGRLLFHYPIRSTTGIGRSITSTSFLDGNPQYIAVDYEYQPTNTFQQDNFGFRLTHQITPNVRLGGTYVHENKNIENYNLKGMDTEISFGENTKIIAEYAQSESEAVGQFSSQNGGLSYDNNLTLSGSDANESAHKIEVSSKLFSKIQAQAYYRNIGRDFSNTSTSSQAGTKKYGLHLARDFTDHLSVNIAADQIITDPSAQSSSALEEGSEHLSILLQEVYQKDALTLTGEWRHEKIDDPQLIKPGTSTQRDTVGSEIKYNLAKNITAFAAGEVSVHGEPNNQLKAGLTWDMPDGKSISVAQAGGTQGTHTILQLEEKIDEGLTQYVNYSAENGTLQNRSIKMATGLRGQLNDRISIYQENQFNHARQGDSNQSSITGVGIQLTDKFSTRLSIEKLNQKSKSEDIENNAFHFGLSYIDVEWIKASTDVDVRYDQRLTDYSQIASKTIMKWKINEELTFSNRFEWASTEDSNLDTNIQKYSEMQFGLAYRPIWQDRVNIFAQYKLLDDKSPSGQTDNDNLFRSIDHLYEVDVALDLTSHLTLIESYAQRNRINLTTSNRLETTLSQWTNRFNYRLNKWIDLIGEYRLEEVDETHDWQNASLVEIDFKPVPFLRIGGGYNFVRFENSMFSSKNVTAKGVFFRITGNFSDFTLKNKNRSLADHSPKKEIKISSLDKSNLYHDAFTNIKQKTDTREEIINATLDAIEVKNKNLTQSSPN